MLNYSVWGASGLIRGAADRSRIDIEDHNFIALNLDSNDIQGVARRGDDLEIHLSNGRVVTIEGYFDLDAVDGPRSAMISANGEVVELDLDLVSEAVSGPQFHSLPDGDLASYMTFDEAPAVIDEAFWNLEATTQTALGVEAAAGDNVDVVAASQNSRSGVFNEPPDAWVVGGLSAAFGAALWANRGDSSDTQTSTENGNTTQGNTTTPTSTPTTTNPVPQTQTTDTPTISHANGTSIAGSAVAGDKISLDLNGDGVVDLLTFADQSGNWSIGFSPEMTDGQMVSVFATSPTGGQSSTATAQIDAVLPSQPDVSVLNATLVDGTSDPNATIQIDVDGDGIHDYSTKADDAGNWNVTFSPPLADQTAVRIVAVDENANQSPELSLTVDAMPPSAPTIQSAGRDSLSGTAEADALISIDLNNDGSVDFTTTADAQGNWTMAFNPAVADGVQVGVTATDAHQNTSGVTTTTIDGMAPGSPVMSVLNANRAIGTAEPDVTVHLDVDGDGTADYSVRADANGDWQINFTTPLSDGVQVSATAEDFGGNTSAASLGTVDASAPPVPVVDVAGPSTLSGTSEPGSTVKIDINGDNSVDYTTVADATGAWSVALNPNLPDGTPVVLTATDANLNEGSAATVNIDGIAPSAPSVDLLNGNRAEGTTEPDATVELDVDGDGTVDYTMTADANGDWAVNFTTPLSNGAAVTVTSTDANGNTSPPHVANVDANAPAAPNVDRAGSSLVSGTSEPGATVSIDVNGDGTIDYTTPVDGNGSWSVTLNPALSDGVPLVVTATDANGNQSLPTSMAIDAIAPNAPIVSVVNASLISGTTEANAQVSLDVDSDGVAEYVTTADANGDWSVNFLPILANGTAVSLTATDAHGNTSAPQMVSVDANPPASPVISVGGANAIAGTAEAGATVSIDTNGDGQADYTTVANASGNWAVTPVPALADGLQIRATATDTNQNESAATTAIIDGIAPNAPVIDQLNADEISGTAEVGSTVTVDVDGNGTADYSTTADASGGWQIAFTTPLAHDTTVSARATDAHQNTSAAQFDMVDAVLPEVPSVDVSTSETNFLGTAEPGATLNISYVNASLNLVELNPVTVALDGSWASTPNPALSAGTDIFVSATDANGNNSGEMLVVLGAGENLDFSALPADVLVGVNHHDIEAVDLSLNASNSLEITEAALIGISQTSNELRIDGVTGNEATVTGATLKTAGAVTIDGELYDLYDFGITQLYIDQDVTVNN